MKHLTILFLAISILLASCGTIPTTPPTPIMPPIKVEASTATQTPSPALTSTPIPSTPTTAPPTHFPTYTPSAPETCPDVNDKLRAQFSPAFRDKKAAYHDIRQIVLDFLNEGGDPQTAIAKLAENDVAASQLDLTNDGVPEFLLPSGYFTVFGCKNGRFETLLDIAPIESSYRNRYTIAVPLVIQDLNKNGLLEIFIAQATDSGAMYFILEWDGKNFSSLAPLVYGKKRDHIFIEDHTIYTVGQSNEEKGRIEGNWGIIDVDGDGLQEIVIKAGVYKTFFWSSDLEKQIVLAWRGTAYVVDSDITESTPTQTPTYTPLPFSPVCDYKAPGVTYTLPEERADYQLSIENFLNAGGDPKQLQSFFSVITRDLTNDGLLDVLIYSDQGNLVREPLIYGFTCVNGKYQERLGIDSPTDRFSVGTFLLSVMAIQDNNQNGFPEIVIKDTGCVNLNCGAIYIAEWDGAKFSGLIEDKNSFGQVDYAETNNLQDAYLKDLDQDKVAELVWIGGVPREGLDQSGLPWRLETHVYKWDGKHYVARLVEYASPVYRFQAVQDGDRFALDGQYEKALKSYQLAVQNDTLGWWSEARQESLLAVYGIGPCAVGTTPCPPPTPDPNEKPILQAYATYRMMLVQLMMNQPDQAQATYDTLHLTYLAKDPAYSIVEMATAFWDEYQPSQNMGNACAKAIAYAQNHAPTLAYIGTNSYHGWQSDKYTPADICPFK